MSSIARFAGYFALATCGILCVGLPSAFAQPVASDRPTPAAANAQNDPEQIAPYQPRFGRKRPLIAVVALNEGTEMTDFSIPFGVLSRSGAADVVSVSTYPGVVTMRPLQFQLQSTIADFDKRFPEGADYLIVPAVTNDSDPTLVKWVASQGAKGGTVVSICIGAMVVANSGLMDGHRATSWYGSQGMRETRFPKVNWQKNVRYVADGKIVSSAGISASIPISIALVEAIAGRDKAAGVARQLGVTEWSSMHNSDVFHEGAPLRMTPHQPQQTIGIPVKAGDDEIALALTAEAYTYSRWAQVFVLAQSNDPIRLAHGLVVLPGRIVGKSPMVERVLAPLSTERSAQALDLALADIARTYGHESASNAALMMEYPGYKR